MRTDLVYCPAAPEDTLGICEVSVEGWRYAYQGIMSDETLKALDAQQRAEGRAQFLSQTALSTFVCRDTERIIGFVDFGRCRDEDCNAKVGEIWAIYVLPEFIGRGVGKALLTMATDQLVQWGCDKLVIWALSDNRLARDFYQYQGLSADGQQRMYQGLLEVRYHKSLLKISVPWRERADLSQMLL